MRKFKLLLIAFIIIKITAEAVPAYRSARIFNQSDGNKVVYYLLGDEHYHAYYTTDGYMLTLDSAGRNMCYAVQDKDETILTSNHLAHNVLARASEEKLFVSTLNKIDFNIVYQKKAKLNSRKKVLATDFPKSGNVRGLVLLVEFSDNSFSEDNPRDLFYRQLNDSNYTENGATGSAKYYFKDQSMNNFNPTFDVYGPIKLKKSITYYGTNNSAGTDMNTADMVVEACKYAHDSLGVDFSKYDYNNDGNVDFVYIKYAGYGESYGAPSYTIWPHASNINDWYRHLTLDDKSIGRYACSCELRGTTGSDIDNIGTFCHEFGHVLGLPDYYDTSGSSNQTLGSWSIMDYGNYCNLGRTPPVYSVYDRFFLGWLTPEQKSTTAALILNPIYQSTTPPSNTINQAFLLSATTHNLTGKNPSPNEFFMLEYRQKTGWDTYLPAEGMCIWHIDFNQTLWDDNSPNDYTGTTQTAASHMHVYLQPLSGSLTTPGTAFTTGSFTPITWDGTDINRVLNNITKTTDNITFDFMSPRLLTTGAFTGYATTLGTPSTSQDIAITAMNLTGNLNLNFKKNIHYELRLSTGNSWSKSLSIIPTSGCVNETVQVRYNPAITGTQSDTLNISSPSLAAKTFNLYGTAIIGPSSPVIYVGKIENTLSFSSTKVSFSNTKLINVQAADLLSDISLSVSGTNAGMFTVLPGIIAKDSALGDGGFTFTITYIPTETGNHTATLTISGGGMNPARVIVLTGSGF